jgi:ubiquinone biosynthesis protein
MRRARRARRKGRWLREDRPSQMVSPKPPSGTTFGVAKALIRWSWLSFRLGIGILIDWMMGRDSYQQRGVRLRTLLEDMPGPYRKVAMQLAMRIDVLPLEVCAELNNITDGVPPFPLPSAIALVEAAMKKPLERAFRVFDPEPIISTTLFCVYQAILESGEKVAVKVRRPNSGRAIASCCSALRMIIGLVEGLTIVRPGVFAHLRSELTAMVLDEHDFLSSTRFQRMLRRRTRKARLPWVTAAKVFRRYTTRDVVVSEFVSGVWLDEVIVARETNDEAALAHLREMNIDPTLVGKRILRFSWWSLLENVFFPSNARPGSVVVQPGSKLVFVNVSDCDILPGRKRRMLKQTLRMIARSDGSEAGRALVQLVSPIPFIDVGEFQRRLESRVWPRMFAMKNPQTPWWERTSIGIWVSLVETGREYNLSYRLHDIRLMRACISHDILAGRVWPQLNLSREFRAYLRSSTARRAREGRKMLQSLANKGVDELVAFNADQVFETWRSANHLVETVLESVPIEFYSLAKKSSYAIIVALKSIALLAAAAVIPGAIFWANDRSLDTADVARLVLSHPVFLGFGFLVTALAVRTIGFRLNDTDMKK